jgi:hypothetical protein
MTTFNYSMFCTIFLALSSDKSNIILYPCDTRLQMIFGGGNGFSCIGDSLIRDWEHVWILPQSYTSWTDILCIMLQCYSTNVRLACSNSLKIIHALISLLWFHLGSRDWYTVKVKTACYMPSPIGGVPCLFLGLFKDTFSNVWYSDKWEVDCEWWSQKGVEGSGHCTLYWSISSVSSEWEKPWKASVRIANLWAKN